MGDQAANLHSLGSDTAITNALLQELDSIYNGQATASFIASSVFDYTSKPYIKGAYGYSTIGMGDARIMAAKPVGHHQTVHGAVESGYNAVINFLDDLKK
jgi:monoamine oxidase